MDGSKISRLTIARQDEQRARRCLADILTRIAILQGTMTAEERGRAERRAKEITT